jgi:hypothetical protein
MPRHTRLTAEDGITCAALPRRSRLTVLAGITLADVCAADPGITTVELVRALAHRLNEQPDGWTLDYTGPDGAHVHIEHIVFDATELAVIGAAAAYRLGLLPARP